MFLHHPECPTPHFGVIVLDAEREIAQTEDFLPVRAAAGAIGYGGPTSL
jgi:hypothetical protein